MSDLTCWADTYHFITSKDLRGQESAQHLPPVHVQHLWHTTHLLCRWHEIKYYCFFGIKGGMQFFRAILCHSVKLKSLNQVDGTDDVKHLSLPDCTFTSTVHWIHLGALLLCCCFFLSDLSLTNLHVFENFEEYDTGEQRQQCSQSSKNTCFPVELFFFLIFSSKFLIWSTCVVVVFL